MNLEKCYAETTGKGTHHTAPTGHTYKREITEDVTALVGNCIVHWTYLEQGIDEVIWAFLKLGVEDGRIVTAHLDARHKMILFRQLGHRHLPESRFGEFATVLGRLEDLYELRNLTKDI